MVFFDMVQMCAPSISPVTLAAIVKTESSFNPLAIGINDKAAKIRQPKTEVEAISTAKSLINAGYSIDIGLGQINSKNLPKLGLTVDDMFNSCTNLKAAETILQGSYLTFLPTSSSNFDALYKSISAYNTGSPTKGFSNGYVKKVIHNVAKANINTEIKIPELPNLKETNYNFIVPIESQHKVEQKNSESKDPKLEKQEKPKDNIMVYEPTDATSKSDILAY